MHNFEMLLGISNIVLSDIDGYPLQKIANHLKNSVKSDVCSIYLLNRLKNDELILKATAGLKEEAINRVKINVKKGLVGLTYRNNEYLFINNAINHKDFQYFPGIGEEPFKTFIGIPLKTSNFTFGVLVFQFKNNIRNTHTLKSVLETTSTHVMSLILKYYDEDQRKQENKSGEIILRGMPLSEGIAIGPPVHIVYNFIEQSNIKSIDVELNYFDNSLKKTKNEIKKLIEKHKDKNVDIEIFNSHLAILEDSSFIAKIKEHIKKEKKSAAISTILITKEYIDKFNSIEDPYIKEKIYDLYDISQRLLSNLGVISKNFNLKDNSIIISDKITPGELASFNIDKIAGFITEKDGLTSHTAIIARSIGIPSITGISNIIKHTEDAETILIDGYLGTIIINPHKETINLYKEKIKFYRDLETERKNIVKIKCDNNINIHVNISSLLDAEKAKNGGAKGVGLFRTEIFYLQGDNNFNIKENMAFYKRIFDTIKSDYFVLRLLDVGADKKSVNAHSEANPALGLRGARYLLHNRALLIKQIEAIAMLYSQYHFNILVPFIANIEEYLKIKEIIADEFTKRNLSNPLIGAMIEIPSLIFSLEELSKVADFFSIGTNDLFQYFFAVDRTNPLVSSLYKPTNRSFLSLMDHIYKSLSKSGKYINICGEIVTDRIILEEMINIGYRNFSINPYALKKLKSYF
jgi:phosphotransferase system enzyme I (PtsP)